MKTLKYSMILFILAGFLGCEDNYEKPNEFSDVQWYTSLFRTPEKGIPVGTYLSFSDLSVGELSHSWSFPDTSGCKFLKGRITYNDTDYDQFIDEHAGTVSEDKTVHILFTKPGFQKIRLYNTFSEYVEFEGRDTIGAVKQGNIWAFDTTFVIDVFDSIQPALKVFHGETEILDFQANEPVSLSDTLAWPKYELEAGEALTFSDVTVLGRPNARTWIVNGGTPRTSANPVATVYFNQIGQFRAILDSRREGENIPPGYKRIHIPLNIIVK